MNVAAKPGNTRAVDKVAQLHIFAKAGVAASRLGLWLGWAAMAVAYAPHARLANAAPIAQEAADAPVEVAQVLDSGPAEGQAEQAADAGEDADNNAQILALRQRLEPIAEVELSFAHRVCRLDERQLASAAEAFGACLDRAVRKLGADQRANFNQQGMARIARRNQGGGIVRFMAEGEALTTPIEQLEHALPQALLPLLNADQLVAYRREREARQAFRRETIVDNLLIILDQRLTLSDKQRADIRQALLDKWDEDWAPPLHAFQQSSHHIPQIPDDCVTPWITAQQCRLYQTLQKIHWGRDQGDNPFGFGERLPRIADVHVAEYQAKPPNNPPVDSAKSTPTSP